MVLHTITNNLKKADKWVPLCFTVVVEYVTVMYVLFVFESSEPIHMKNDFECRSCVILQYLHIIKYNKKN